MNLNYLNFKEQEEVRGGMFSSSSIITSKSGSTSSLRPSNKTSRRLLTSEETITNVGSSSSATNSQFATVSSSNTSQLQVESLVATSSQQTLQDTQITLSSEQNNKIKSSLGYSLDTAYRLLFEACNKGDVKNIKLLLKNSPAININKPNTKGLTPLDIACEEGHLEVVKFLAQKITKRNQQITNLKSLVIKASLNNRVNIISFFWELIPDENLNKKIFSDTCVLHIACEKGYLEIVKFFVNKGIAIGIVSENGTTALHLACQNGHLEVVKFLVNSVKQANDRESIINKEIIKAATPLYLAYQNGHLKVVNFLRRNNAKINPNTYTPLIDNILIKSNGARNYNTILGYLLNEVQNIPNVLSPIMPFTQSDKLEPVMKSLKEKDNKIQKRIAEFRDFMHNQVFMPKELIGIIVEYMPSSPFKKQTAYEIDKLLYTNYSGQNTYSIKYLCATACKWSESFNPFLACERCFGL